MSEALRNSLEEDCLKPPLSELKLEPETETHLDLHTAVNKSDKIRQIVSEHSSAESQKTVEAILEQVAKLTTLDKLLLYLKLPNDRSNDIDPLRQPLNPLGSRSEIQQTIIWIKTHLQEDPQVSLPKHEVYDEYIVYCSTNSIKPLSTADFGKVMKQVYPQVRPRRLGTRGNSRYCYAGLRKRLKLDVPLTPDINSEGKKAEGGDSEEELNNAASFLIREWVEKLLQVKFESLKDLAYHLLEKMYVDNRSVAAFTLLSSSSKYGINATIKTCLSSPTGGSGAAPGAPLQLQPGAPLQPLQLGQESKHSTATLQLQRKLVEREQKRKLTTDHQEMQQVNIGSKIGVRGKRSKIGPGGVIMDDGLDYDAYESSSEYDRKYCPPDEPPSEKPCDRYVGTGNGIGDANNHSQFHGHTPHTPLAVNGAINESRNFMEADGEEVQPRDFSTSQYSERIDLGPTSPILLPRPNSSISIDKLPRKKQALAEVAASIAAAQNLDSSSFVVHPSGLGGMAGLIHNSHAGTNTASHSLIKAGEKPKSKYKECDEGAWLGPAPPAATMLDTTDQAKTEVEPDWGGGPGQQPYDEPADLTTLGRAQQTWPDKQVLESGGSSSDPQEEELARYFSQTETEGDSKNDKLSQLRQLLEQKLKSPTLSCGSGAFKRTSLTLRDGKPVVTSAGDQGFTFGGAEQSLNNQTLSNRRRVSFNPLIVSDPGAVSVVTSVPVTTGQCPVPPSPGTRRRHFSFQPISPRQGSLPQSPPASPFISPRSTPVHMLRSRHNSASALPLHLLPGSSGRQQHPSGSGSDISRAATFGSASESSTPFISPQGTPIPFSRSRHNSAQGRLCPSQIRSRHSSGVPLTGYRYTTMPYSPMALNNLNNPFSPQPATPISGQPSDQPDPCFPLVPGSQFISPGDDPRSRHSSAGSDHAPRSAPLSPMIGGGNQPDPVRTRHQSAGNVPSTATATIHYRPAWQHQHPADFNSEVSSLLSDQTCRPQSVPALAQMFHPGPYTASQPPTPGALDSSASFNYPAQGIVSGGPNQSHHSSYSNTPIPPDYNGTDDQEGQMGIVDKFMTEELSVAEESQAGTAAKKSDDDDLGLALDALRDCDNEFSKFVQETVGSTSCTTTN